MQCTDIINLYQGLSMEKDIKTWEDVFFFIEQKSACLRKLSEYTGISLNSLECAYRLAMRGMYPKKVSTLSKYIVAIKRMEKEKIPIKRPTRNIPPDMLLQ